MIHNLISDVYPELNESNSTSYHSAIKDADSANLTNQRLDDLFRKILDNQSNNPLDIIENATQRIQEIDGGLHI